MGTKRATTASAEACPGCGARVPKAVFVCGYCGAVLDTRVRTMGGAGGTFEEMMEVVQNNLDALHALPRPTVGSMAAATARVFVGIYTFGIAFAFWKKPRTGLDGERYRELSTTVERNLALLRVACQGSPPLEAQVAVLVGELARVARDVRRANIVRWAVPVGITLTLFVIGAINRP